MYSFENEETVVVPNGFKYNLRKNFQVMLRINRLHVSNPRFLIPTAEFVLNSFTAAMASYNGQYGVSPEDKALFVQFVTEHTPKWVEEVLG